MYFFIVIYTKPRSNEKHSSFFIQYHRNLYKLSLDLLIVKILKKIKNI